MTAELTDDDKAILVEHLRETIAADRFQLSPPVRRLKAILVKLDPPAARPEMSPPPTPPGEQSMALTRKRRR
jgi:hypothetical protein